VPARSVVVGNPVDPPRGVAAALASRERGAARRQLRWRGALSALAVVAMVGWVGAARAAFAVLPLGPDQGLYITIGELIKHGGVPYRDAWDNKPPGTYYLYAAVLSAGPDYVQECVLSGRLIPSKGFRARCAQIVLSAVDAVWALATAAAVWAVGRRLFGPSVGVLAALLCSVFVSMIPLAHGGNTPDLLALLPGTLAVAAALHYVDSGRRSWLLLAGVLGAIACLFKQTGIVILVAIGLWLVTRRAWRAALALSGAAAVVVLATAALFARLGALPDMVQQVVLWNGSYVASPGLAGLPLQAARQSFKVFMDSQSGLWLAALGAAPLVPRALRGETRLVLLAFWVVASVAGLALGGARFFQYYYVAIVPPLAVCGGWALAALWARVRDAPGRVWLAAAAASLFVFSAQLQAHELQRAWYGRLVSTTWAPEEFVGGSLQGDRGSLFVWGNGSQVYALSGNRPAARFLHTLALSNDFARAADMAQHRRELMAAFAANPPDHIVLDTPWLSTVGTLDFPELRALLSRDYVLANDPTNPTVSGWEVYRRVLTTSTSTSTATAEGTTGKGG